MSPQPLLPGLKSGSLIKRVSAFADTRNRTYPFYQVSLLSGYDMGRSRSGHMALARAFLNAVEFAW